MASIARLDQAVKLYDGAPALGPVSVNLDGNAVGIIGPNGSGKTTMIRLLMGLSPPTDGGVEVLGEPVTEAGPDLRRRIGYVPEGDALFPGLSGVESVVLSGQLAGLPPALARTRAHEVLDYVELDEERYRMADQYSQGMRQRLKLAQALVHDPDLLILDEPTEAVDPETRRHLTRLFLDLRAKGVKLLISTHLLHDLEEIADSAIVLADGRLAAKGTLDELRAAKQKVYQLRVNGSLEPVIDALRRRNIPWAPLGASIQAEVDHPRILLQVAAEADRVVRHLAPVERSLEEAFEEAVEHPMEVDDDE